VSTKSILMLCAVVLGTLAAIVVAADEDPPSEIQPIGGLAFMDEIEITVVNVVAFVTDKQGNHITDLTMDGFKLYQDVQQRQLTNFQLYTEEVYRSYFRPSTAPRPDLEPTPEAVAPPPELRASYMAIYIDHENLRPLDRNRTLNQMQAFVRNNCRPPVEMMVASYNRSLKVIQPFTSDADQIRNALREMRTFTGGRTNRDSDRKDIIESMERYKQDQQDQQSAFYRIQGQVSNFAREEENDLQFTLGALREMITMISGLPGKKSILYISNGLPMVPGLDLYYGMANAYDEPSQITEATRYAQYRQFDSLVAAANSQGVTFYAIGAGGLESIGMSSAEYSTPQDTMAASVGHDNYLDSIRFMADGTGGRAIVNTNDIRSGLEKIEQDFYTYYSLGYTLHTSGHDKVHKIKVEIPDHPEYRIRYRRRFVEKSLENRVQDRVVTGLMFPIEENPMRIRCDIGEPAPASEKRWTVPFELSFPIPSVALMPEGDDFVGRVTVYLAVRDTKGKQSDVVRQEHEVRVPSSAYEDARTKNFTISSKLLMEQGSYKVAVALLDRLTRQASYQTLSTSVGR
jgi:VWFA-related protein